MSEQVELTIERLAYRGAGVARREGLVYFVPGVIPGERVVAEVTQCHTNYVEARAVEWRETSPDRIERCCLLASGEELPGAVYDHMRYGAEVRAKAEQLSEVFNRRQEDGAPRVEVEAVASPRELHYRNKAVLHVQAAPDGTRRLGYWTEDRSRVVDVAACPLSREEMNVALAEFRAGPHLAALRERDVVTLRWTAHDGALCWVNEGRNMSVCKDGGDVANVRAAGIRHLTEAGEMKVMREGFYQVNPEVSQLLVGRVADWFERYRDGAARVFDLFCGVGVFGIACGMRGAEMVQGMEVSTEAVACARENALHHNVRGRFASADIERSAMNLIGNGKAEGMTVIVDPPRRGLAPQICQALNTSGAPHIIYVSCDPATLGRDLPHLLRSGYRIRHAAMFDMFPRTMHFESAVDLVRV